MHGLKEKLQDFGEVKANAPLAKFTTFKIGGPAEWLVEVSDTERFVRLLTFLSGEGIDFFVLGGGSNLLLPDEGIPGVVIRVKTSGLAVAGVDMTAEAGVSFAVLVNQAVKNSLSGLEWAAGLPGTVGGAVRGNAGAMGGDVAGVLKKVTAWRDGETVELSPSECAFGYRDSIFKHGGGVVLSAVFALTPGDQRASVARMQDIVKKRNGHYPPFPSGGSFFKNVQLKDWPQDVSALPAAFVEQGRVPAGWLCEQANLKSFRIGGAMVSREHGNFLINFDHATQADMLAVVEEVKKRVYTTFGVELEEEVHIITP